MVTYTLYLVKIFSILFCFLDTHIQPVDTASCIANTDIFGETSPSGRANALDTTAGQGYLLLGSAGGYTITCCGVVTTWTPFIDLNGATDGTVYFQIWRPSGAQYQLVGENQFTFTANGEQIKTATTGTQISIRNQDRIGWYTDGPNILKHKSVSGSDNYILAMSRPAVNSIQDWSGASVVTPRAYGLRVDVSGGATPSFTSPASGTSFTVTNDKSVGYLITTLTWSDADVGDTLTASMTSSTTKVEFNNTSGELKVASLFSGPSETLVLGFAVEDYCGNSFALSIFLNILNEPPTLHGLSASGTIDEDSTGNVLIYTINATDRTDTVSCAFTAATLEAAYPFSVRMIPSSTDFGIYIDVSGSNYSTNSHYALEVVCSDGYADSNTYIIYVYLPNIQTTVAGKRIDGEKIGFLTAICLLSAAFFLSVAYVAILKRRISHITPVQTNRTNIIRVSQYNEASPSKSSGNNITRNGVDTEMENVKEVKAQNSAPIQSNPYEELQGLDATVDYLELTPGRVVGNGTAATSGPKSLRK